MSLNINPAVEISFHHWAGRFSGILQYPNYDGGIVGFINWKKYVLCAGNKCHVFYRSIHIQQTTCAQVTHLLTNTFKSLQANLLFCFSYKVGCNVNPMLETKQKFSVISKPDSTITLSHAEKRLVLPEKVCSALYFDMWNVIKCRTPSDLFNGETRV